MRDWILAGLIGTVLALVVTTGTRTEPRTQHWCVLRNEGIILSVPIDAPAECVRLRPRLERDRETLV